MVNKTLLTYKTKSLAKKNTAERTSKAYSSAEHIGILFTIEDLNKHEKIKGFIEDLEDDGKQVDVLAYLPKNKENHEFFFDFFTAKDFNFWGSITSDKIEAFASKSFDYLLYLDNTSDLIMRNLLAKSNAKCRVGKFSEENEPFCEMMINTEGSVESLIEEIYKYTKILS